MNDIERCPKCGVGLFRDHNGANRCMVTGKQHPCAPSTPPLEFGRVCKSNPPCTPARDLTLDHRTGVREETRRYGYRPASDMRFPNAKDSWVILCTVPGARGPFTERRTVTYTEWEPDARDQVAKRWAS